MKRLVCLGLLGACSAPEFVDTPVQVEEKGSRYSSLNSERGVDKGQGAYLTSNTGPVQVDNRRGSFPLYRRSQGDFLRDLGRISGDARQDTNWQEDNWLTFVSGGVEYAQDVGHSPGTSRYGEGGKSIRADINRVIEVLRLADPGTGVIFNHPHPETVSPHSKWGVDDAEKDLVLPSDMDFLAEAVEKLWCVGETPKVPISRVVTERYICEYWSDVSLTLTAIDWFDENKKPEEIKSLDSNPIVRAYQEAEVEWCIREEGEIQAGRNMRVDTFIELLNKRGLHVRIDRNQ